MSKLTPEAAFNQAKALFTDAIEIKKHGNSLSQLCYGQKGNVMSIAYISAEIDWGDLARYPPEPEPEQWRDAVWPDDWGRYCRWNKCRGSCDWDTGTIVGYSGKDPSWIVVDDGFTFDPFWASECQVRVTDEDRKAPITRPAQAESIVDKDDGSQPMHTAPKDREIELLMGGEWIRGMWSRNGDHWMSLDVGKDSRWDEANRPTAWRPLP